MPTYTVTISNEGQPVIDKAFTAQNGTLTASNQPTLKTIDDFLTWVVEKQFGITAEEIKAMQQKQAADAIVTKISALPIETLSAIAVAVDAEIAKGAPNPP